MNKLDTKPILLCVFKQLRQSGFSLGVGEYLVALQAVKEAWESGSQESLAQILQLLWCHSLKEQSQFREIWESEPIIKEFWSNEIPELFESELPSSETSEDTLKPYPQPLQKTPDKHKTLSTDKSNVARVSPKPSDQIISPQLAPLPVRAPFESEYPQELQPHWPIDRRSMVYAWRYLRRSVAVGPGETPDIKATVDQTARQGFFLAPVYRRREYNFAHLLLLLDRDGSMTPFHHFTRDLVETAKYESTIQVKGNVFYFHNVPTAMVYRDPHLTDPVPLEQVLSRCDSNTNVLVISDAGAARGHRKLERIRSTTEFLVHLKQRTRLIAWLNPMPKERWPGTSAQIIAHLVPMCQMDKDGLNNAIDIVRGQPLNPNL